MAFADIAGPCLDPGNQPDSGDASHTLDTVWSDWNRACEGDYVHPLVAVIMGSRSDWETLRHASETLDALGISHERKVVSAHRTPDLLFAYVSGASARGIEVIIAGAGGAAHLPGMAAAKTALPVLGVPVESAVLHGIDSLLSMVQMPAGVPVGTLAIGRAGAVNAALMAASILGLKYPAIRTALERFRATQTQGVLDQPDPGTAYPS